MLGVGPEDAQSNISAWFELAGLERAAEITSDWAVESALIWACASLVAVSFVPNIIEVLASKGVIRPRQPPQAKLIREAQNFQSEVKRIGPTRLHNEDSYYRANLRGDVAMNAFEKKGFNVPKSFGEPSEKTMVIHQYLEELMPLIGAGYVRDARRKSKALINKGEFRWDTISKTTSGTSRRR